jgi:hypothetical protein
MEKMMEKRNVATERRNLTPEAEEDVIKSVADAFNMAEEVRKTVKKAFSESNEAVAADEAADSDTLH